MDFYLEFLEFAFCLVSKSLFEHCISDSSFNTKDITYYSFMKALYFPIVFLNLAEVFDWVINLNYTAKWPAQRLFFLLWYHFSLCSFLIFILIFEQLAIMGIYNIQKTKIMASGPITSWEVDGETVQGAAQKSWLWELPWLILKGLFADIALCPTNPLEFIIQVKS